MARIGTKPLSALCRRLAISLESGIDERKTWQREAERAIGRARGPIIQIRDAVSAGQGIGDAVEATGSFFPPLFRELVQLGDRTGKSAAVYRRLADHYEHRVKLRRMFLAGITWPVVQLTAAVVIVGFLIWILGVIGQRVGGTPYDSLGLGLIGTRGLLIYVTVIGTVVLVSLALVWFIRRGGAWTRPIQQFLLHVPGIGGCLRTLALSQLSWSLGLSLEAGMDIRRALPFALQSTRNIYFAKHIPQVTADLARGDEVFAALARTGAFPNEFLDVLQVGEQSGRMDESMLRLADQYQDRARAALATLTTLAGFAVWALVALMIIAIIVSIVASYANLLQDLSKPG